MNRVEALAAKVGGALFPARPFGTEDVYELYIESFRETAHLRRIQEEAQAIIAKNLAGVMRLRRRR